MKNIFKRINIGYYIALSLMIFVLVMMISAFKQVKLDSHYSTFLIICYIITFVVIIGGMIQDVIDNKNLKTLIGIPSSDYDVEVFDSTRESFKNYNGIDIDEFCESYFYKDLYRIYGLPITEHMRKLSRNDNLLKITVNDKGVQSVKKLKQKVIKR